ncbi:MAG TPA: DinB family protein [Vicinamibacterales bacterium]|nr:DinB family protein [Vicinamibacterales bacterium]
MHPRMQEILSFLDLQRAALARAYEAVPPGLRSLRPAPDRWSAAEVIGHLTVVEGRITQVLRASIDAATEAGLGPDRETSPVVPTVDVDRILDRSRAVTASAGSQPPAGLGADDAWATLEERRADLRRLIHDVDGLALQLVTAANPVLGSLNAYQWLVFVGAHERRHAAQIDEITAALTN